MSWPEAIFYSVATVSAAVAFVGFFAILASSR